uniref:ETS variant transcription factor 3 n=1 Tax=Taeniopygia guttata TaxID=59729 RepID=A0A674GXA4_TAEGU
MRSPLGSELSPGHFKPSPRLPLHPHGSQPAPAPAPKPLTVFSLFPLFLPRQAWSRRARRRCLHGPRPASHFPPLEPHRRGEEAVGAPSRRGHAAARRTREALGPTPRGKPEPAELEESGPDLAPECLAPVARGGPAARRPRGPKSQARGGADRSFSAARRVPPSTPHSPFAVSPLPGRPGVLNVPISPALSLTPTLSPTAPRRGSAPSPPPAAAAFSFNPEEMKHYLHSQACSVFNYHLSPRTFPRYPLVVPPLQCPVPAWRSRRSSPSSCSRRPPAARTASAWESPRPPARPRVKVEPAAPDQEQQQHGGGGGGGEGPAEGGGGGRGGEGGGVRPPGGPGVGARRGSARLVRGRRAREKAPRECPGEAGGQERREDALMPPKLRLKRRWNGDSRQEAPRFPAQRDLAPAQSRGRRLRHLIPAGAHKPWRHPEQRPCIYVARLPSSSGFSGEGGGPGLGIFREFRGWEKGGGRQLRALCCFCC